MSLFAELKRRNVFRVGIGYAVMAWLILQVADVVLGATGASGLRAPLYGISSPWPGCHAVPRSPPLTRSRAPSPSTSPSPSEEVL